MRAHLDIHDSDWIADFVDGTDRVIGGLIPDRFQAYRRVFSGREHQKEAQSGPAGDSARIASSADRISGSLSVEVAQSIARVLRPFTLDQEQCSFAIWIGYGGLQILPGVPIVVLPPGREMALFSGRLDEAGHNFDREPFRRSALWWWPASHEWCLAGDIYSRSVVIGGPSGAMEALAAAGDLEVAAVSKDTNLTAQDL
jgi:hypothetical protein